MYFIIKLHKQELEKANSQNVEQRRQREFFHWFKKFVRIN